MIITARSKGHLDGYTARPVKEHWEVGKDSFDTTQQLIDKLGVPERPVQASYHFQRQSQLDKTTGQLLAEYVPERALGGAVIGGILGGGLAFVGGFLNAIMLGAFNGGPGAIAMIVGGAGLCAGMGALTGVSDAITDPKDYAKFGEYVNGTITAQAKPDGEAHLVFHPWNQLSNEVDLPTHALAPVETPGAEEGTWWATQGHSATPI